MSSPLSALIPTSAIESVRRETDNGSLRFGAVRSSGARPITARPAIPNRAKTKKLPEPAMNLSGRIA